MLDSQSHREHYIGNNSTDEFDWSFLITAAAQLIIIEIDDDGNATTLQLGTDYTLDGISEDAGGTATRVDGNLPTDWEWVMYRDVAELQSTNLKNQGAYFPQTVEAAFDYAMMILQWHRDNIDRSMKLSSLVDPSDVDLDFSMILNIDDFRAANGVTLVVNDDGDGWTAGPTVDTIMDARVAAAEAVISAALARDWAINVTTLVNSEDNSAKAYAVGGTGAGQPSAGDAKSWAVKTSSFVITGQFSAKEWAVGVQNRGLANGGSSKDWAVYTGGTVNDVDYSSKHYAQDAAASALAAQTAAAALRWPEVAYKTFADSPITIADSDRGTLFIIDTSGGAVVVNMPSIAALDLTVPWVVGIEKSAGANNITINKNGTDTVAGTTSITTSVIKGGVSLIPSTDGSPDNWEPMYFGPDETDVFATSTFGTDNRLVRSDGTGRGAQSSGITVSDADAVSGVTLLTVDNVTIDGNTVSTASSNPLQLLQTGTGGIIMQTAAGDITIESQGGFIALNAVRIDFTGVITAVASITTVLAIISGTIATQISVNSASTGANVDLTLPTKSYVKFTNASLTSIRSIGAGANGMRLVLTNDTGVTVTLANEAGAATAANRIVTGSGSDLALDDQKSVELIYDSNDSRWRIVGGTGAAGGGGGGGIRWVKATGNAPISTEENGLSVEQFTIALAQELYTAIRVPTTYTAGKQIYMKVPAYSPDTSGTNLLSTVATLIRTGTDAVTSTTNQRTSANAAINLATAALANKVNSHLCDLSDSLGKINSVAIAAGDLILVKLTRGTDTGTSDIKAIPDGAEVTFNG